MIEVEVTENDIVRSIRNTKFNPLELALCKALKCEEESLDIHRDEIKVWIYDEADHFSYKFVDKENKDNFNFFMDNWLRYVEDETIESFDEQPFVFYLKENKSLQINPSYSFSYDEFTDRPSADRKNPKFRLTDDDK